MTIENKPGNWWKGASLYQVYPRSFKDSNQDGVGDLKGLTEKLNYIASLGVQGVWLGPVFQSPMVDFGYDVSDYKKIDPLFGSESDFDELVEECHKRQLKIIADLVLSHTSEQHEWFKQSLEDPEGPFGDWYVWSDAVDGGEPNNWLSVFGGSAWTWNEKRQQYYFHNFLKEQPDLNFHNPHVREAILDVAEFWLKKGVDGFRLDACNCYFHDASLKSNPVSLENTGHVQDENNPYFKQVHIHDKSQKENYDFMVELRKLSDRYPDRFLVGEIFCDREAETTKLYTENAYPLHSAYNFSLLQNKRDPGLFRSTVSTYYNICEETSWSLSNHDVTRVVSRWKDSKNLEDRAKSYLVLLIGLPGMIFLYQGEELGLEEVNLSSEYRFDPFGENIDSPYPGRDGCRTPIPWEGKSPFFGFSESEPWLPIAKSHESQNVASQLQDPHSVLSFAKKLLKFRNEEAVFSQGNIQFWCDDESLLAYSRSFKGKTYLILSSLATKDLRLKDVEVVKIEAELSAGVELDQKGGLNIKPGAYGVVAIGGVG